MSASLIDTYSSIENDSVLLCHVRTIVKFYIWPLLVLFGLTGNCLSILVLTRRRLIRTSTNNYLTILAVFDSCYLIFTLLLNLGSHPRFALSVWTDTFLYYLRPLADFSSNTATWLIVCFTLERTLAVTKPIYAKRRCSVRRSRHLIGILLLISFVITLPRFFERNFLEDNSNRTKTENIPQQRIFLINFHRFYLVLICVIIIWIPLLVLCICNSILICYVHRFRYFDENLSTMNPNESFSSNHSSSFTNSTPYHLRRHSRSLLHKRRVTIILIFCLSVAVLLWTPQSLSLTYEILIESYADMSHKHQIILLIFNNFANLFLCINASIDFLLYCFLSEKFARTCRQILCHQCPSSSTYVISQQPRQLSMDRTSLVVVNPTNNLHQQQSAAKTTNKYYVQLYDLYQNSSGYSNGHKNNKWKKKFVRLRTTTSKNDLRVFYQTNFSKIPSYPNTTKIHSNPVLDYIDENNENNGTIDTSLPTSAKQSRSGTLSNV